MLPYLTRVSFWLAALAAGMSLFTPGAKGAALASVAMVALVAALVLRRFALQSRPALPPLDRGDSVLRLDDTDLLDVAAVLARAVTGAATLAEALRGVRHALIHELGAQDVTLHEAPAGAALVVPQRYPLGEAQASGEVAGSAAAGYALPVQCGTEVVALLSLGGTALDVDADALGRMLAVAKVSLDALARREAAAAPAPALAPAAAAAPEPAAAAAACQRAHELEEACRRFADLADAMQDTLFVANPERTRFEFVSASAFETFGVSPEAFGVHHGAFMDTVLPEDRPLVAQRVETERRGEPADVTYRIRHVRKGLRFIRSRTRTRLLPDGTARVYGLVCDVTHEREHEVELERARDAAEAASRAKSQFMANMSHEIRTPMNGILGMTELLLGTPLNDTQRRFAKAVYRSGESLLEIINDILDFSTIEAGRLELAPTDFSLRAVVEDTLELLAPRAHEKLLELGFRETPGLPAMVHGDPLRLRQVLTNLVANAIKFTERGEVLVELKVAPDGAPGEAARADPGSLWLEFGVSDTGIGIDAAVLPRLFGAFTQGQGGMSRRYGGTGLGLAVSKQLVEMMGGSIAVRSAPGVGSTFTVRLPVRPASGDGPPQELDGRELAGMRVLVVDDHETPRTVLENMLGAWGVDVTVAADGRQALAILEGRTVFDAAFDVALVDLRMPGMDGLVLARALRAQGSHPSLKLILMSSATAPDDVRAAQSAGYERFVAKPVRKAELRQALLGVSADRRDTVAAPPRLTGHVLVIEDNPVNQEVIAQMLRHAGLKVRLAGGALPGFKALCEAHFDLVLMDIQMPGMDGVEALGLFRRGGGGRFAFVTPADTPVVAVTANALEGDQARFLALGFDDYLSKPFRQSQLLAMLTKRLRARPAAATGDAPPGGGAPRPPDQPWVLPAGTESVLDAGALERLRELDPKGENQLLARVIQAFDASAARLVPQLEQARAAGDLAGIRHVAHTLKSSSASIGAIKLSQLCADIETRIRTEQLQNVDERVEALRAEIGIVLQALKRLLDATS